MAGERPMPRPMGDEAEGTTGFTPAWRNESMRGTRLFLIRAKKRKREKEKKKKRKKGDDEFLFILKPQKEINNGE